MRAFAWLFIGALALAGAAQGSEPITQADAVRGRALVEANCSSCHAVNVRGNSPAANAPAFRTIAQTYPVAHLEEALAEGMTIGGDHALEAFAPNDVNAIIAYLETIQTNGTPQRRAAPPAVG